MSVKTENHWGMLKDIWKIMWPAALPLYLSYFYYRFVGVYTSGLLGQIMDLLLYRNGNLADSRLFLKLALAFLFSLLLMPSVDFLTNIVIFRKGLRYEASVVDRIFRKDYEAFGSCQSAEWAARVSSDPLTYRNMAILAPVRLLADGTVFLTALYASLQRDARLALLLTAGIWLSIALRFFFRKWDNRYLNARQDWQNRVKARQAAIVRAHSFWLSYGCAASLPQRMKKRFGQFHRETGKPEASLNAATDCVQRGLVLSLFLVSLLYGLRLVERDSISAGDFVTIYFLMMQMRTMAESILTNLQVLRGFDAQQERMAALFGSAESTGSREIPDWQRLSFEGLSYTYPGTQGGMPRRDFGISPGETLMLEGENGSGKTTLLKLLGGLFPEKNGQIRIDGLPLAELNLADWRGSIGYVQQFPHLFPGTVRENVRIGNLDASEARVDTVLEKLGLSPLADRLLNGTDPGLSGGEVKRVELARLLLRLEKCRLLMLDEPFENLDEEGRKAVWEVLRLSGKAILCVSHKEKAVQPAPMCDIVSPHNR